MESQGNDQGSLSPPAAHKSKSKSKSKDPEKKTKKTKSIKTSKTTTKARSKPREDITTKLGAVSEGAGNREDDVEKGLTHEQILELRTLDVDSEGDGYDDNYDSHAFFTASSDLQTSASTKLYVENETSGEFFRVRSRSRPHNKLLLHSKSSLQRLQRQRRRRRRSHLTGGSGDADHSEKPSGLFSSRSLQEIEAALMLLSHGIVVGLSWMDAFNLGASQDRFIRNDAARVRFVCTYSGLADRSRQLFFLLFKYPFFCLFLLPSIVTLRQLTPTSRRKHRLVVLNQNAKRTLVMLGLMRKISRLRLQQHGDDFHFKSLRLVQGALFFTTISLLVLLIASPSALRLASAYATDPNWCDQLIIPSGSVKSSTALSRIQQCAVANAVFLSLGYLLVCIESTLGISSHASLRRRLVMAHTTMDELDQRAEHLEGKNLDELSIDALKDLIQLHQRAVESTEGVLVTKLQIRHPTTAAVHWWSR